MKKIIGYLNTYLTTELKPLYLASILIFMSLYVFCEYYFELSLPYRTVFYGTPRSIIFGFLSFFIPFFGGYLIYAFFYKNWLLLKKPLFWFLLVFGPAVFCMRTYANTLSYDIFELIPKGRTAQVYFKCCMFFLRDILIMIPVWIYWVKYDKKNMPFYGFTLKNYNLKPYLFLLVLMVPIVIAAAFQSDFLQQYPRGFSLDPLDINNPGDRKYFLLYELFYGLDFVFIEFFFRGFLLLAFFRHFGWSCLLPAACFYVSIHFGKPVGETLSSFFGGTILGIIAINTGSIAGGIIVHLGVAWLMEVTSLLNKIL